MGADVPSACPLRAGVGTTPAASPGEEGALPGYLAWGSCACRWFHLSPPQIWAQVGAEWLRAQGTLALPVPCPLSCSWGWQLPAPSGCSLLISSPSAFISSLLGAPSSCLFPLGASNLTQTPLEAAPRKNDAGGAGQGGSVSSCPTCRDVPAPAPAALSSRGFLSWAGGWRS